ncbi:LysR family transcriptional regulator [Pelagibacterium halotolerans]|uniref:Transcriptional regulator lysR family n=1 Tax=Pelagibacterium halotolerans (strain DSM 22347 / JCM 15775 / CGMCC 1.7692 / B2) TaxID=1082931 RepID=G4R9B6_PELHB|nr:LysR family transcriptional regulator [Pelagibacterium halotolerans]AEQ53450.1 transcriptional regulator lysR family [Pelagibacterium halotolerans B2]QJR20369.1 LysR family transcriptional regulator [Pelagibacterium halotolerans]SEA60030.1 transcriptional regulator, LysR family [Pelagibacterium halotolerans]
MKRTINWDDQRIFLAVLEAGSLSGAARRLGLSHPTVRSRIEALEADLGVVLFTRSMTGLTPTEAAEALREPAQAMATASQVFIRRASAPEAAIAGVVRLSVPDFMGIEVVPAMLERLRVAHPAIRIELSLSNLPADLMAQEVDLAVRAMEPKQKGLVARKVANIPLGFFASKAYVARRGQPLTTDQLAAHDIIGPDRNLSDLALAGPFAAAFDPAGLVLRTDSHPAQLAAARAGLGIALVQVPTGNADAGLVRILPDFSPADIQTWIVTHENLARVPRVRAVFDALVAGFHAMMRGVK